MSLTTPFLDTFIIAMRPCSMHALKRDLEVLSMLSMPSFEPYEVMEIPSKELGPIACDTKSVGVESRKTEPELTLLCLPHDCLVARSCPS